MPAATLSREDWVSAALVALLAEGAAAVAVQPLARALGATKGSFYWHFDNRDDLLSAALDAWADARTEQVIATLEALEAEPAEKVRRLFATVTASAMENRGELRLLAGVDHPLVAAAVAATTDRRVAYVASMLAATGLGAAESGRRAVLAYATYLGFAQLAAAAPAVLPDSRGARAVLLDELVTLVLAR